MSETREAENTDREIWRERPGDFYSDSIHVTRDGGIGIDCGGFVIVKPLREWHRLASDPLNIAKSVAEGLATRNPAPNAAPSSFSNAKTVTIGEAPHDPGSQVRG